MTSVKERHIEVLITADTNEPHGIKFAMPGGDLVFENKKHDGFMVYFNIVDPDSTKYRFPDDLRETLWVKPIAPGAPDACPDDYAFWDQFDAREVLNDNKTLRVRNKNKEKQRFGFTLRVTKKPTANGPCIPYDPIGDNRNGPTSIFSTIAVAAIGVVAIAAIALVAFTKLNR